MRQYDLDRIAYLILKFADTYEHSPEYRWIVNGTRFLSDEERHESMRLADGLADV